MADWPLLGDGSRCEAAGISSSAGTTVTANAAANTEGSYAQLIASTAFDARWVLVYLDDQSAQADYLVDLAVGAAASEQIVAADLLASAGQTNAAMPHPYLLPLWIPAGSRLAARCQSSTGGADIKVSAHLFTTGFMPSSPLSILDTYGAAAADSGGVSVDPGGTINTKGAWSELTASTTRSARFLWLALGNQINTVRSEGFFLIDVGVGAGGSEQVILPNLRAAGLAGPDGMGPFVIGPLPVMIPSGVRVAARAQCSINDATDRLFDAVLYLA